MKWYFAVNELSLTAARHFWEPMIAVAVQSAIERTSLEPHLLYDGDVRDPFLQDLASRGVFVHHHRVSFYDALAAHSPADPRYLMTSSGAFLRTEIPALDDDEFVVYTDCDVLFRSDPDFSSIKPKYFACSPEFDRSEMEHFNTGVMLMNLPAMRSELNQFRSFISQNLSNFQTYDQDAYKQFYKARVDVLPNEFNWRPYWGENSNAVIAHFHGPKPEWAEHLLKNPDDMSSPNINALFHLSVTGYRQFVAEWLKIRDRHNSIAESSYARLASSIPPDFDSTLYYDLNPDVRNAGVDAKWHFLTHGRNEGRSYRRRATTDHISLS